jgi:NAD-dependent dihydropyrimidine dehydrogenase PreA subunit
VLKVDKAKCSGDAVCVSVCPVGAPKISETDGKVEIDSSLCVECYACMNTCPQEAIYEEND